MDLCVIKLINNKYNLLIKLQNAVHRNVRHILRGMQYTIGYGAHK